MTNPPPFGDPDYRYGEYVPPAGSPPAPSSPQPPPYQPPGQQQPPYQPPSQQYPPPWPQYPQPGSPYPPMNSPYAHPGVPLIDVNAPQPGIVPLRRSGLDVGDIVSGVVATFRRDWKTVLALSAIIKGIQSVLMISTIVVGVIAALPRLRDLANLPGNPTRQQVAPILPGLLAILLSTLAVLILIYLVTRSLLSGLIAIVVSEDLVGRRIGVAAALSMIRPALGRLLIQGLLGGLALGVGLVLCVIPGLWLIGVWGVATPALALERASVPDSFTRSYTLVKKMFWRVFGIRALAFLAATVCSYVLSIPFNVTSSFGVNSSNSTIIILLCVLALAQFLVSLVTAPITAIVDAMLYIDLRIRKEGLAERLRAGIPARQF